MEFVPDGNFYIRRSERDTGRFIPYCPLCWKSAKVDVPLNSKNANGFYSCDIHKSDYITSQYRNAQEQKWSINSRGEDVFGAGGQNDWMAK